jgi:hypothetical protein
MKALCDGEAAEGDGCGMRTSMKQGWRGIVPHCGAIGKSDGEKPMMCADQTKKYSSAERKTPRPGRGVEKNAT